MCIRDRDASVAKTVEAVAAPVAVVETVTAAPVTEAPAVEAPQAIAPVTLDPEPVVVEPEAVEMTPVVAAPVETIAPVAETVEQAPVTEAAPAEPVKACLLYTSRCV